MAKREIIKNPVQYLKKEPRKNKKTYATFVRGLLQRKVRGLDSFAGALHKEAFKKIDCLKCANCCKTMSPTFKKVEIKRIAHHLGLTYQAYYEKYLYKDDSGDIMNKQMPCQHLQKDNKCSIYRIRPSDCSGFPHTQKKDFKLYISSTHLQNISYCPATLSVVKKMYEVIIEKGKRNVSEQDAV